VPVEVVLPRVDMAMERGSILSWKVAEGQAVRQGDLLFELETDKSAMEVEAEASGVIAGIRVPEGLEVPVGTVVAHIYAAGEPIPAAADPAEPVRALEPARPDPPSPAAAPGAAGTPEKVRATPLARRLAREHGVALAEVRGTGPAGRISGDDVRAAGGEEGPGPRFVDLSAGRMAYREWTAAEPRATAVLLHGLGGGALGWQALAAALARAGLRVVAPDLPGHGATAIEAAQVDDLVDPVREFRDRIAPGAALVGHSLGAVCAARAALDGTASLTLIAPAGIGSQIDGAFVAGMAEARTPGALAHLLRRLTVRPLRLSERQLAAMAADLGRGRLAGLAAGLAAGGTQQVDILPDLARVAAPVRVVVAIEDAIVPWTQVAQLPPAVAVHVFREAGHMLHWDRPADLAALLAPLLSAG
jgi:pimeloyl-ACP methyl ester carboxylesterase